MQIDLVIFDCDGVLVDSETITARTIVDAMADEGLTWSVDQVVHQFRGRNLNAVREAAEAELGAPLPEEFVPRFRERLFARLGKEIEVVPGILAALDGLEALGLPYCVASNGPRAKMETTLAATDLLERFGERIFTAYEVGSFKPAPDLFLHAAEVLGTAPAHCAVIEDSESGLAAAHAAGMTAVAYVGHGVAMDIDGSLPLQSMHDLPALLRTLREA